MTSTTSSAPFASISSYAQLGINTAVPFCFYAQSGYPDTESAFKKCCPSNNYHSTSAAEYCYMDGTHYLNGTSSKTDTTSAILNGEIVEDNIRHCIKAHEIKPNGTSYSSILDCEYPNGLAALVASGSLSVSLSLPTSSSQASSTMTTSISANTDAATTASNSASASTLASASASARSTGAAASNYGSKHVGWTTSIFAFGMMALLTL